jgi:hypothetical protein
MISIQEITIYSLFLIDIILVLILLYIYSSHLYTIKNPINILTNHIFFIYYFPQIKIRFIIL